MKFIAILSLVLITSCAHLKPVLHTVEDLATAACTLFGKDHPAEFKVMVEHALPPGASREGFNPAVLCKVLNVVRPFLDQQFSLQNQNLERVRQLENPSATVPQ